jgi:hypothetical protein
VPLQDRLLLMQRREQAPLGLHMGSAAFPFPCTLLAWTAYGACLCPPGSSAAAIEQGFLGEADMVVFARAVEGVGTWGVLCAGSFDCRPPGSLGLKEARTARLRLLSGISLAPSYTEGDGLYEHPADLNPILWSEECTYARAVDAYRAGMYLEYRHGDAGRSGRTRRRVSAV